MSAKSYLEGLNGQDYAGFNLIVGDKNGLFYYCNRSEGIYLLPEGVHALGNLSCPLSYLKRKYKNVF